MEVDAGSHVNFNTEFYDRPIESSPAVELTSKRVLNKDTEPPASEKAVAAASNTENVPQSDSKTELNAPVADAAVGILLEPSVNASQKRETSNVGKYRLLRTIGKGNFAKVKLAIHMATGVEVAIKMINKTVMDNTLLKRLKREITIMKVTNHPCIVKLLEIIENEYVLCLVMEYASGGEIFDYLVANGKMREKEARIKFRQLISAIQYCHSKRIVHRDLKAENILLDRNLNVKVADFGLANTFDYDQRLTTFCGSPPYAAPELFLGIPYFGPSVDVWSLGVILFTLVLGHLPFDARDLRELRSKILGLQYSIPKNSVTPECESLLRKMLTRDPKDRSSLKILMQDKWINMGYSPQDLLKPYKEPPKAKLDDVRLQAMQAMGFTYHDLEASVINPEFDHVYATYHLLPETPSHLAVLCEESSPAPPNSVQKSSTSKTAQGVETAIGRFTVAPSGCAEVTSRPPDPLVPYGGSNKSPLATLSDSTQREHHSIPVALRKAFIQVGRTFVPIPGAPGVSSSPTGGPTVETGSRSPTVSRTTPGRLTTTKSGLKQSDAGRTAITAAPVPIGSSKKSAALVQNKRLSSDSSYTARSGSGESASTTGAAGYNRPSPSFTSGQAGGKTVSSQNSPPASVYSASPTHVARHSTPLRPELSVNAQRIASNKPYTPLSSDPHVSAHSGESGTGLTTVNKVGLDAISGSTLKPSSVGSASSTDSCDFRDTATTFVHTLLGGVTPVGSVDDNRLTGQSSNPIPIVRHPSHESGSDHPRQTLHPLSDDLCNATVDNVLNTQSLEPITLAKRLSVGGWSMEEDKRLYSTSEGSSQRKASHTIQGTESREFQEQALRLQSSRISSPRTSVSRGTNSYATDINPQSTWSRGVLKAFSGLFTQSKVTQRLTPATPASGILSKPREVRFPWSVHTTSTKQAQDVLQVMINAIALTAGCRYAYDVHLPFLIKCSWASDRPALLISVPSSPEESLSRQTEALLKPPNPGGVLSDDPLHWEMEVCQLPRLHLRGVRLKRIRGSALQFRILANLVMNSMHL